MNEIIICVICAIGCAVGAILKWKTEVSTKLFRAAFIIGVASNSFAAGYMIS